MLMGAVGALWKQGKPAAIMGCQITSVSERYDQPSHNAALEPVLEHPQSCVFNQESRESVIK